MTRPHNSINDSHRSQSGSGKNSGQDKKSRFKLLQFENLLNLNSLDFWILANSSKFSWHSIFNVSQSSFCVQSENFPTTASLHVLNFRCKKSNVIFKTRYPPLWILISRLFQSLLCWCLCTASPGPGDRPPSTTPGSSPPSGGSSWSPSTIGSGSLVSFEQ